MHRLAVNKSFSSTSLRVFQQQFYRKYNNGKYKRQQYNYSKRGNEIPPHFVEAGFGKLLLLLSPVAVVGGTIAYAKRNEDFRKLVEQNVPGAEKIFKVALSEESMFSGVSKKIDSVKSSFDGVQKSIKHAKSSVTGFFGADTSEQKDNVEDTQLPFTKSSPQQTKSITTNETKTIVRKGPTVKQDAPVSKTPPSTPNVKETPIPHDIVELEKEIELSASLAVKEYKKAIDILKNFNEDVRSVVEQAIENLDPFKWNSLKNRTSARDTAVSTAEDLAQQAIRKIERCEIALSKIVEPANQEKVMLIRNKIKNFEDHIKKSKDELYENKDLATISEKYWRNVEKARNYFVEEAESLFPGLNLTEKKLDISKDDIDLFLLHAYSHVLALQKELQRLQTDGELRLKRAIEAVRGDSDNEVNRAQLEYLLEAEKGRLAIENQKKISKIRAESAKELRSALKKQSEAHIDHLNDALALKENELKRNYNRELEEKLAAERGNYKLQLAAMLGKLHGMDAALQARAESERSAHQAQALWAACQALWAVVRTGEPGVNWRDKLRPLKNEIHAISKVAEGDELVAVVLQNMPQEAQERGVYPEDALRERFIKVERMARQLALVPDEGASIPMYVLSYLQAIFIMKPDEAISKEELHDKPFDFSKLDTYDILNRARYFVDHGDLMQALKYMNLLQGAPRKIASDWLKEARLLLETQQAANTLMAHAAASGLLYL